MILILISILLAHCLLCLTAGYSEWRVTHRTSHVCGIKGASVVLPCTYYYPSYYDSWGIMSDTYQRGEWYRQHTGTFREHKRSSSPSCDLRIDKLSDEHMGVYHFRFRTTWHNWITDENGVKLTVTDLQVREDVIEGTQTQITCRSTCSLGSDGQYVWYKNGQQLSGKTTASILLDPLSLFEVAYYSCAVKLYAAQHSETVCVPKKRCWAVKCVSTSVCALSGTLQHISCIYTYPSDQSIEKTSWEKTEPQVDIQLSEDPHELSKYTGKTGNVTFIIHSIKDSDSGRYVLKMALKQGKTYLGSSGLNIFVTSLQVRMTPDRVIEGERVTLTCHTTCSLTNNPTFTWYKNGQPLLSNLTTRDNMLQLNPVSSEESGNYSCVVGGHESLSSPAVILNVRYKPKNAVVSLNVSGEIIEGTSVTLTCSSDANPPVHNYTWYMKTGAESLVRGTGESISFNVTSDTSGLYYCQAHNEVGSQTSADIAVQRESAAVPVTLVAMITTFLILAALLLGIVCVRKNERRVTSRATNMDVQMAATQDQDDVQYSSIRIKHSKPQTTQQDDSLTYASVQSNRGGAATRHKSPTQDQDDVQYSSVRIKHSKPQITQQDDSITYASVQFNRGGAAPSKKKKERMTSGTRATHADIQTEAGLYDIVGAITVTQDLQQAATQDQDDVQYSSIRIKDSKPQTTQQDDSITYA